MVNLKYDLDNVWDETHESLLIQRINLVAAKQLLASSKQNLSPKGITQSIEVYNQVGKAIRIIENRIKNYLAEQWTDPG